MAFDVDVNLIVISFLFFFCAYFVGIRKQTWVLSGFNQARVRDKDRLAKIAGFFLLNSGLFMLLNGLIHIPYQDSFLAPVILAYGVGTILYVNKKLVE
ncbi:DUF3784 domain-containing protein [Indiicoccus explosivorum]|uniref:DUF3784 domain-containing protein n=1 Tax=Indiicoccus explosivorum TaxID=1917864 RepID=UPI000B44F0EB|nr:DUF3784 domain-containing protein [Indiicoccus explosivorum]